MATHILALQSNLGHAPPNEALRTHTNIRMHTCADVPHTYKNEISSGSCRAKTCMLAYGCVRVRVRVCLSHLCSADTHLRGGAKLHTHTHTHHKKKILVVDISMHMPIGLPIALSRPQQVQVCMRVRMSCCVREYQGI